MADNPYSTCDSQSSSGENERNNSRGLRVMYSSLGQSLHDILGVASQPVSQYAQSLSPEQTDQVSTEIVCAICLEDMDEENGEIFTIPVCKHKFHESCVKQWKKEKATCPSCRGIMPEELGLTDEHIWIGDHQLTFNARPPPEPTFCHIVSTIPLTPFGIVYSLLVVFLFIAFELLFFVFIILFFLMYAQWYSWVETDDVNCIERLCNSITSVILFPFLCVALLLIWLSHLYVLFFKLGMFYGKVMTCQCRWTDTFSETVIPAIRATQALINESQSDQ